MSTHISLNELYSKRAQRERNLLSRTTSTLTDKRSGNGDGQDEDNSNQNESKVTVMPKVPKSLTESWLGAFDDNTWRALWELKARLHNQVIKETTEHILRGSLSTELHTLAVDGHGGFSNMLLLVGTTRDGDNIAERGQHVVTNNVQVHGTGGNEDAVDVVTGEWDVGVEMTIGRVAIGEGTGVILHVDAIVDADGMVGITTGKVSVGEAAIVVLLVGGLLISSQCLCIRDSSACSVVGGRGLGLGVGLICIKVVVDTTLWKDRVRGEGTRVLVRNHIVNKS